MNKNFPHNKLIECPEPGILFTRDNAAWAYHALKAVRESGRSIPEQDELCDELAAILFPAPDIPVDRNIPAPAASQCPDWMVPHEDDSITDGADDDLWDEHAWSLLPTGAMMNPARPEDAAYYDKDQVAYIVTGVSQDCYGVIRVLTSYGRLNGWNLNTLHTIRHDQSCRSLGRWRVTGIRNYKTGWQKGEIPDRPVRQWVFK